MKRGTEGILNTVQKLHKIISDIRCLGQEEEKDLFELRVKSNISRINILIVIVMIIECMNLYMLYTTEKYAEFRTIYLYLNFGMIGICTIQLIYFYILEWKYPNSIRKRKWYINLWLFPFILITWSYHGLELMENDHFENLFLLLVVLNIILILSNKEIIICLGAILGMEYGYFIYTNGSTSNYQWAALLTVCSGIIGRVFYIYYMHSNLLQWKLKKTNEKLEEQINRYRVLQALTEEDIFEYNYKDDKMIISYASGKPARIYYNYLKKVETHYLRFFSDKDESIILEAYQLLKEGDEKGTFLFQVETTEGKKSYQTIYTTVYDDKKNPVLTIGKLYQLQEDTTNA